MYDTLPTAIEAEHLGKRFDDLWALQDVDLSVPTGTVLGLLGHNGAGKTTAIRILTTLAVPTTGRARVAGHDVVEDPGAVRAAIGLAAQAATVDGLLSGRANLEMVGRLYHLSAKDARARAGELLERLDLVDAADKLAKTYSGGMRRRLDLAASIVASPPVLFLDEPTTGLDPRSRSDLWALLRELVADHGVTILLTTQYLDEADRLADDIMVLDHGKVAAHGTPAELKQRVGGQRVEATLADGRVIDLGDIPMLEALRRLEADDVEPTDVVRREATLDDVFLALTSVSSDEPSAAGRRDGKEVAA